MSAEFNLKIVKVSEDTYELRIDGEDDTIGHLLSTYLELSDEVQLSYYTRPHPLEEKIIVYVRLKDPKADVGKVVDKVIDKILSDLNSLKQDYVDALRKAGVDVEELIR